MASTKRVYGDYNVYTNRMTVHGDLTVTGTQTAATTVNSQITNNMFLLNAGELGTGITAGTSGLKVNRGILPNTFWMFSEVDSYWSGTLNGGLTILRAASPLSDDDVVTKGYLGSGTAIVTNGNNRTIQFNNAGALGSDSQLNYFANGNVQIGTTLISNTAVISTTSGDIVLDANGAKTYLKDALKLQFQTGATPSNVASTIQIVANAPGEGGSGLYVVNTLGSDELINKRKATWLGLVFS